MIPDKVSPNYALYSMDLAKFKAVQALAGRRKPQKPLCSTQTG
jgi:hypothetical protein